MVGIYKIQNLVNKKIYIGQSENISQRWKAHRNRPFNENSPQYDSPIYRAIRKYGLENFSFEVVEECEISELNEKEIYWIEFYDSNNDKKGYNLTKGGDAVTNGILKHEQILEIYDLLENSKLPQAEIASLYGVSQRSISGINTGQTWVEVGRIYPIRSIEKKEIKYYCKDCGAEISTYSAVRCEKCAQKAMRKVKDRPTPEQLEADLKASSFLAVGRKYGVSDTAIRKWCTAYGMSTKAKDYK